MLTTEIRSRTGLVGAAAAVALLGLASAPAATAQPAVPAANPSAAPTSASVTASGGGHASSEVTSRGSSERWCRRNVSVLGLALHDGQRIENAKVRFFAQRSGKDTTFSQPLSTRGAVRTNSQGGFMAIADCLPRTFMVQVSGGTVAGARNHETMTALGARDEKYVLVTPATSVAVAYLEQHPELSAREAVRRVTRHLGITAWGPRLNHLGHVTSTTASEFDAGQFLSAAGGKGQLQSFAAAEARHITSTSRHSFAPADYRRSVRPGFPDNKRKSPSAATQPRFEVDDPVTSILMEVASKAVYSSLCVSLPPGPATNLICTEPGASSEASIESQLDGISQQLTELNTTVSDINSTLSNMSNTLSSIQSSIQQLQQQGTQQSYVNDANAAQQNYATAFNASGVQRVASLVQEALGDLQILGAIAPTSTTWTPTTATAPTDAQICATMYSTTPTKSGDDPQSICEDFLTQVEGFTAPSTSYYTTLYQALVGGPGVPQDDLLIYTYQQMLSMGGHVPVSGADFANIQSNFAQIGALMDSAYALAASAAEFRESATSGFQPSCPNLVTSGTLPATTAINVSDACRTLQSGLFVAAVHNAVAASVTVPPLGTVIDPSTNYVWWSYPVDLTATTQSNPDFPLYPGAPAGTYSQNPIPTVTMGQTVPDSYTVAPEAILANEPAYTFTVADLPHNVQLIGDLLITHGSSVASTLNAHGFTGIGTTNGGMTWSNLGADPLLAIFEPTTYWQSSTPYPADLAGCTGYPANVNNVFHCSPGTGGQVIAGLFAGHSWDLTQSTVPTAINATTCPTASGGFWFPSGPLCWTNTFGLLVDTSGPEAGPPPWWSPAMLQGVPSEGVPAIPVPTVSWSN